MRLLSRCLAWLAIVGAWAGANEPGTVEAPPPVESQSLQDLPSSAEFELQAKFRPLAAGQASALLRREVSLHRHEAVQLDSDAPVASTAGGTVPCIVKADAEENATPEWHYCKLPQTYSIDEQRTYIDCVGTICQDVEPEFIQRTVNESLKDCGALVSFYKDCMIDLGTQSSNIAPATLVGHICNTKCPEMCRSLLQEKARRAAESAAAVTTTPVGVPFGSKSSEWPPLPGAPMRAPLVQRMGQQTGGQAGKAAVVHPEQPFDVQADIDAASRAIAEPEQGQGNGQIRTGQASPASSMRAETMAAAQGQHGPVDYPVDEWREQRHRQDATDASSRAGQVHSVELPPLPGSLGNAAVVDAPSKRFVPEPESWPPLPKGPSSQPPAQPL